MKKDRSNPKVSGSTLPRKSRTWQNFRVLAIYTLYPCMVDSGAPPPPKKNVQFYVLLLYLSLFRSVLPGRGLFSGPLTEGKKRWKIRRGGVGVVDSKIFSEIMTTNITWPLLIICIANGNHKLQKFWIHSYGFISFLYYFLWSCSRCFVDNIWDLNFKKYQQNSAQRQKMNPGRFTVIECYGVFKKCKHIYCWLWDVVPEFAIDYGKGFFPLAFLRWWSASPQNVRKV